MESAMDSARRYASEMRGLEEGTRRGRERRTVFDSDRPNGICYYREYAVIVWMDLAIRVYMRVKTQEM